MSIDPKNPDTTIEPGDRVRSHDFPYLVGDPNREPCYVEGEVEEIIQVGETFEIPAGESGEAVEAVFGDCARYVLRVERRVFAGDEIENLPTYVFPPVNGTPTMGFMGTDRTYGVEKIEPARTEVFEAYDDSAASFVAGYLLGRGIDSTRLDVRPSADQPGARKKTIVTVETEDELLARNEMKVLRERGKGVDPAPEVCEYCGEPGSEADPIAPRLCSPYDDAVSHVHKGCGAKLAEDLVR